MEVICGVGIGELLVICFGCCLCVLCYVYVEEGVDVLLLLSDDEVYVFSGSGYWMFVLWLLC